jgi:Zn-finger nucleic acid-binding protein
MELFARQRHYFCRHCGTFHFLENPEVDGVRVLERSAGARPCPRCGAALATATLDNRHVVQHCEHCRGVLVPRADFADAVTRRRTRAMGPGSTPEPLDPRQLDVRMPCPSCGDRMDVHPYFGPGNVVIDSCARCDLIWLDFGELQQITEAPGRDRGPQAGRQEPTPAPPGRTRISLDDLFG